MTAVANVGAICEGLLFGSLSEKFGRRRAIVAAALVSIPALPFWAFGSTPPILAAGAFAMQFAVQGAWGWFPFNPERTVSAGDPCNLSGVRLPTRQSPGRRQFESTGGDRRGPRQRLRAGDGERRRHRGRGDRVDDGARPRTARHFDGCGACGRCATACAGLRFVSWSAAQYLALRMSARDRCAICWPPCLQGTRGSPSMSAAAREIRLELLAARFPTAAVSGFDSSADMISAARKRLPEHAIRSRRHRGVGDSAGAGRSPM